ncbi:transposase [Streptomyces sp. NPDC005900]|uniref:transposase n=1 Tax=Streptomyces sp. NPDC005900 TaxID=3154569 RepID=UPI0033F5FB1D
MVEADTWAKNEAMPSDEEVSRIRRLIDRVRGELDQLTKEDHTQILEAVTIVRRARNGVVGLGLPRIRQPLPDVRPERPA